MRDVNLKRPQTLALLRILARGDRQVAAGRVQPAADVVARLRKRLPSRGCSSSLNGPPKGVAAFGRCCNDARCRLERLGSS